MKNITSIIQMTKLNSNISSFKHFVKEKKDNLNK